MFLRTLGLICAAILGVAAITMSLNSLRLVVGAFVLHTPVSGTEG